MRIIEQIQALVPALTDQFVIDGSEGTRRISFSDLLDSIKQKIGWPYMWEGDIPVTVRRNTWRGKNLGSEVTEAQWNEIAAGTFKGMFLGDYWEIDGRVWRIVDFDYWLGTGSVECTTHHLVIMPDHTLYNEKMNLTSVTTGGYFGSYMVTGNSEGSFGLSQAFNTIDSAFESDHLLVHNELLTNAVTNGYPSNGSWHQSTIELPSEIMIYGSHIVAPMNNGTVIPYNHTNSKTQLAGMRANPTLICPHRENYWLRDVVSATAFAAVDGHGGAGAGYASNALGVRPVFGIK